MAKNKNKKWDASKMEEAIQLVKKGMSKYEAAIKCCIGEKKLKSTCSECRLKLDFEPDRLLLIIR